MHKIIYPILLQAQCSYCCDFFFLKTSSNYLKVLTLTYDTKGFILVNKIEEKKKKKKKNKNGRKKKKNKEHLFAAIVSKSKRGKN